jgi:hypothetical protein
MPERAMNASAATVRGDALQEGVEEEVLRRRTRKKRKTEKRSSRR